LNVKEGHFLSFSGWFGRQGVHFGVFLMLKRQGEVVHVPYVVENYSRITQLMSPYAGFITYAG
jgi:hypothetical protein